MYTYRHTFSLPDALPSCVGVKAMVAARPSWPKLRLSNKCSDSYQVRMKNAPNLITRHLMHNGRKVSMPTEPGPRIATKFEAGHFYERSEEHTSELQSLMRISYDVF